MKIKEKYWIYAGVIIIIGFLSFYWINQNSITNIRLRNESVYVESGVYKNLEKKELVINGITYTTTINGFTYTWVTVITKPNEASNVLSSLSTPEDFLPSQYTFESSLSIGITRKGLEKLKNHPSVLRIEVVRITSTS